MAACATAPDLAVGNPGTTVNIAAPSASWCTSPLDAAAGDEENLRIWHEMIRLSQTQFDTIYGRLGVKFDVTLGESFYNGRLQRVVDELKSRGFLETKDSGGLTTTARSTFHRAKADLLSSGRLFESGGLVWK